MKKIKENLKVIIAVMITVILMSPFSASAGGSVRGKVKISGREYYATNLKVTKVNRKTDTVYCKNWCGFSYHFKGVSDLEKGDVIACIMYTKGTPNNIKDDVVLTAKYERVDLLK